MKSVSTSAMTADLRDVFSIVGNNVISPPGYIKAHEVFMLHGLVF